MNLPMDKRPIGLHLRMHEDIAEVIQRAVRLELDFFQCFLIDKKGVLIHPTDEHIATFHALRERHFSQLYVHGSYWINLADRYGNGVRICQREIACAKKLGFTHFVLHPGHARVAKSKQEGIETLVRALEKLIPYSYPLRLILENTTHAGLTVGSDIQDFAAIRSYLSNENIGFCLDTGHAYAYGYDISNQVGQDAFIQEVDEAIGLCAIDLIHLNDTYEPLGSRIDRHSLPGGGNIGMNALKQFATRSVLAHVPLIFEPPVVTEQEEKDMLARIRAW